MLFASTLNFGYIFGLKSFSGTWKKRTEMTSEWIVISLNRTCCCLRALLENFLRALDSSVVCIQHRLTPPPLHLKGKIKSDVVSSLCVCVCVPSEEPTYNVTTTILSSLPVQVCTCTAQTSHQPCCSTGSFLYYFYKIVDNLSLANICFRRFLFSCP